MLNKWMLILSLVSFSILSGQYDYILEDINMNSEYYGQSVGTSLFDNQVTIHYFGHFN